MLFADLHEVPSAEPDRTIAITALLEERKRILRPVAAIERRIAEANLTVVDRLVDAADSKTGPRLRDRVLSDMYGPFGVDPWDPRPLLPLVQVRSQDDSVVRAIDDQRIARDAAHRAMRTSLERFWATFRETMSSSADERSRILKSIETWHAAAAARGEQIVAMILAETDGPGRTDAEAVIAAWRAGAERRAADQRREIERMGPAPPR
jgi:hypothetical protein